MTQTANSLPDSARKEIAASLGQSLADTVVATMLAQNFHWNVKGMAFGALHPLFQEVYEDHFAAQDALAERIRALSEPVDGRMAAMLEMATVIEHDGDVGADEMVTILAEAQRRVASGLSRAVVVAREHEDAGTEDLCLARMQAHEKFAWMLSAHLGY